MDINEITRKLHRICWNVNDTKKVDKIINAFIAGKVNKDNYWETICKFTKNVHSDHSLSSWQCIAERAESLLFEDNTATN